MAKKKAADAPLVDRLSALDAKLDHTASRAAEDFTNDVGRALRKWWRAGTRSLDLEESGGNLRRTRRNEERGGAWARSVRSGSGEALLPVIRKTTTSYIWQGVSSALAGNRMSGWNGTLDRQDQYLLDRLIARRHKEMHEAILTFVNRAQNTVSHAVQSSQAVKELRVELDEYEDQMLAALYRMADRLVYDMAQTVIGRKAGVGSVKERRKDAYLYSGPIDRRCRPFCLGVVGRVWSKGAIDRMDNGQLPNTFVTRGGYNCRHLWRPVDGELAKLADTGKFASPDLQAQYKSTVALLKRSKGKVKRVA